MKSIAGLEKRNFVVYPNSGESYDKTCNCWKESGEKNMFINYVDRWYSLGAKIIGGCCRTGPEEIRYISDFRAGLMETVKGAL
jgi:homocysteine S-methyltransferase